MKTFNLKMWLFVFSILFVDQLLKILIKTNLSIGDSVEITPWFFIYFVENNGFAFGLEFFGFYGKFFLTLLRIFFVFIIFNWINRLLKVGVHRSILFALLLIFSGAIGNIFDSVFYGVLFDYAPLFFGRVVDMFYFPIVSGHYPDWFPFWSNEPFVFFRFIFNIADSCITIGAILLLFFYKNIPVKY